MKRTIVVALVVFVACATILWAEDGPAKKEKIAKEWLKYMEGEWQVTQQIYIMGGRNESLIDVTSHFVGDILVSGFTPRQGGTKHLEIAYWDRDNARLVICPITTANASQVTFDKQSDQEAYLKLVKEYDNGSANSVLTHLDAVSDQVLRGNKAGGGTSPVTIRKIDAGPNGEKAADQPRQFLVKTWDHSIQLTYVWVNQTNPAKKEEIAKEWLEYMAGEWKVKLSGVKGVGQGPRESRLKATMFGSVLLFEDVKWQDTEQVWYRVIYVDLHTLTEEQVPADVVEPFIRTNVNADGQSGEPKPVNSDELRKAVTAFRRANPWVRPPYYPVTFTVMQADLLEAELSAPTPLPNGVKSGNETTIRKTENGFVRHEKFTYLFVRDDWTCVYERVTEVEKK